ncbi:cytochrome c oxidase assembly protein COX11, mitochondrial isoform X1 [Prosopis cineraria]|uniref:cytochrome c oxidase assembly protein COX11, mitochondrial isoform X1 n=1 Tax=Prosopis cineraria TaxID=364024 RepID=UPI00240F0225|nr:cytochrome c oxidase assembly protein COX11, mitochondrial isoform X1 [Prosopis cineraria]XP_054798066.1 cytochrome c oxidase assembly protein COX11, mitochondrial isoform X1 [Prosopis cineraria]XP_054798067.1 cytochrome c oxidase assembly protein COX11, mitochondrial isoform X1 [Prosopis cineraria]
MLCSRLIKRTHLSLYLKNLQQLSSESRCLFIVTEGSSKTFTDSINGFQRNLSGNIWLSNFKRQLSTKSLYQIYGSSAFAAKNGGRSCALPHFRQFSSSHLSREQKSRKMLIYLSALVVAMVGSSYAAVPLYRRFCQATGYGGTIQRRETVEEKIARHDRDNTVATREIVVQFNADVADGMPWKFTPTQREVRVKPGESALAFYTAENKSSTPIVGVSTYNVTPMKAAVYFNKIQCFCFEEQRLLPGEQIDMPVFFYIDPEFESDRRMDGINNIILSYTFFKVSEE